VTDRPAFAPTTAALAPDAAPGPLAGVLVLDLSRVFAGPLATMALGDLGAEVVKVEHPERGDDTRDWGVKVGATESSYYLAANRNKRSIAVDLAADEGRDLVRALARKADIVIENFRKGTADRMGLGYAALAAENPGLVYCSISGYGRDGAEGDRPGYDVVVQGEAGLMAMNGEADRPPVKFGIAAVDLVTGLSAGQAILAALFDRGRSGRGRHIELSLFDCGIALTSYIGVEALTTGREPLRAGNGHPAIVPYGVFAAADGPIVVAVGTTAQFRAFCRQVIGRPDLADDPRFSTNIGRSRDRAALLPEIAAALAVRSRAELLDGLAAAGIPAGEVLGLAETLAGERVAAAGLVVPFEHPEAGPVAVLAPPFRLDGERAPVRRAPPGLGADTDAVLAEHLCLDAAAVARLRAAGIVR